MSYKHFFGYKKNFLTFENYNTSNCTNFFRFFTLFQVLVRFFTLILACTFGGEVKLRPMWLNKKHCFCCFSISRQFTFEKSISQNLSLNFFTPNNLIVVHTFLITPKNREPLHKSYTFKAGCTLVLSFLREDSLLTNTFFYKKNILSS